MAWQRVTLGTTSLYSAYSLRGIGTHVVCLAAFYFSLLSAKHEVFEVKDGDYLKEESAVPAFHKCLLGQMNAWPCLIFFFKECVGYNILGTKQQRQIWLCKRERNCCKDSRMSPEAQDRNVARI